MSVFRRVVKWAKLLPPDTNFALLVPFLPWENDPRGHFVLVDLIAVVIYFNLAWLVVDQCGKSNPILTFTKVV
jgi:hypothetical protein